MAKKKRTATSKRAKTAKRPKRTTPKRKASSVRAAKATTVRTRKKRSSKHGLGQTKTKPRKPRKPRKPPAPPPLVALDENGAAHVSVVVTKARGNAGGEGLRVGLIAIGEIADSLRHIATITQQSAWNVEAIFADGRDETGMPINPRFVDPQSLMQYMADTVGVDVGDSMRLSIGVQLANGHFQPLAFTSSNFHDALGEFEDNRERYEERYPQ